MHTYAKFIETEKLKVSVTITQTLKEWVTFLEQLDDDKWPSCDLTRQIREVVRRAQGTFLVTESSDNGPAQP